MVGFERIQGLVLPQMACQLETIEGLTIPGSMQVEKWPLRSTSLHRYERSARTVLFSGFCLQHLRQLFDGRCSKEGHERNPLAKDLLHASNQARSQQRMASHIEKVVPNPNR